MHLAGGSKTSVHISRVRVADEVTLHANAKLLPSLLLALRALYALQGADAILHSVAQATKSQESGRSPTGGEGADGNRAAMGRRGDGEADASNPPVAAGSNRLWAHAFVDENGTSPSLFKSAPAAASMLCQLQCLATAAVCAHMTSPGCADACVREGVLDTLLAIACRSLFPGNSAPEDEFAGADHERLHVALLNRFHGLSQGAFAESDAALDRQGAERGGGGRGEDSATGSDAAFGALAQSAESRRDGEMRLREQQRNAMALDLSVLGYSVALCKVALQVRDCELCGVGCRGEPDCFWRAFGALRRMVVFAPVWSLVVACV
jgi:hypothetical protein